ncbi:MAG: hypothetical protein J5I93_30290 [Pirellulaceae bacterium]|nr:hypothetical protein [Pirellulaceae bacterium]
MPEPCEHLSASGQSEVQVSDDAGDYLSDEDHRRWDDEPEGEPVLDPHGEGETGGAPAGDPPGNQPPSAPGHQPTTPGHAPLPVPVPTGTGTNVALDAIAIARSSSAMASGDAAAGLQADDDDNQWDGRAGDESSLATGSWRARSASASGLHDDAAWVLPTSRTGRKAGLADQRQGTGVVDESLADPLFVAELASLEANGLASELASRLAAQCRGRSNLAVSAAAERCAVSPTGTTAVQAITEQTKAEPRHVVQSGGDVEPGQFSTRSGRSGAMLVVPAEAVNQLRELNYDSSGNAPGIAVHEHVGSVRIGSVLYLRTEGPPAGFRELEVALPDAAVDTAHETAQVGVATGSALGG